MTALLLIGVTAVIAGLVAVYRNERERRDRRAGTVSVVVDEWGVTRELADGRREQVAWSDVAEVEVLTTKVGVHRHDGAVIIIAGAGDDGCLVPSGAAADSGVLEALTRLPGFDSRALTEALAASPPSRSTCWRRG